MATLDDAFFTNLANLLNSPPDSYSSLSGKELVKKKVKQLVSMAASNGKDGKGGNEFNVVVDAKASQKVFKEWPTPIVLSLFHIGEKVMTGIPLINDEKITNSPVKDAFDVALKNNNQMQGRNSCRCRWTWMGSTTPSPIFAVSPMPFARARRRSSPS